MVVREEDGKGELVMLRRSRSVRWTGEGWLGFGSSGANLRADTDSRVTTEEKKRLVANMSMTS